MKRAKAAGWVLLEIYLVANSVLTLVIGYGGAWDAAVATFVLACCVVTQLARWRTRRWKRQRDRQLARRVVLDAERILLDEERRWIDEQVARLSPEERRRYELRVRSSKAAHGLAEPDELGS